MKICNYYIKKRNIVAVVITVIVLIALNNFWNVSRPLPVSFDLIGNGNCNVEIQFNQKDNDEFKKIATESATIELGDNSQAQILVKKIKYPKRMRIKLSGFTKNQPLTIGNIKIRDGKWTIDDVEKFKVEGAASNTEGNKITLTPNGDTITLTYPDTLHIRASIRFQFEIFVIIIVLTYLLAYKLSDYVADFKTVKGKSRLDIIFMTIIFTALFIPMLHINQADISTQENRTLAIWQPLITDDGKINFEFGKAFNEWFNDRFTFRDFLVELSSFKLIVQKNWITDNVIKGKDGWLFLGGENAINSHNNSTPLSQSELEKITNYLTDIDDYCKKNNKNFYFVIAPDKSKIYEEYYYEGINKISNKSRADRLLNICIIILQ